MSTKIRAGVLVQSATCRLGACFPACQPGPPVAPPPREPGAPRLACASPQPARACVREVGGPP